MRLKSASNCIMDCVANRLSPPRFAINVVCSSCDKVSDTCLRRCADMVMRPLFFERWSLVRCLSYSATALVKFVSFPFAPFVETFHFVHHPSEHRIQGKTTDHAKSSDMARVGNCAACPKRRTSANVLGASISPWHAPISMTTSSSRGCSASRSSGTGSAASSPSGTLSNVH